MEVKCLSLRIDMSQIIVLQQLPFKKAYKKLSRQQKTIVNLVIKDIVKNPKIGVEKKGDLKSVFVYKFKISRQEYLLAYSWNAKERILCALGVHQNFYKSLKRK